ncbi:glycosyltransferase family 4 protein [Persicitalea jodogahamensis]|uniref:Glycosyltransferase subfamily 4-like N-terminal domain-containing protein n=1 Tax=Persicitalea jodogahamensis TaxID=402147 RepID=A0A8J3GAI5_9BACT|nr:glycosyltransferase family 4 protein [Persicitalea jodogahamensis]GHB83347.1 hypothetical protein GCM10007390_42940 [Persicitalea jodogahamensis]
MNILLVLPSLLIGGAEVFAVRLANKLAERNHRVFLLMLSPDVQSDLLAERVFPQVRIVNFREKLSLGQTILFKTLYTLTQRHVAWYEKVLFERKKIKAKKLSDFLEKFCREENIHAINSHLSLADWSVAHYFWVKPRKQKFIVSMHGCYNRKERQTEQLLQRLERNNDKVFQAVDHIVLLTPKNAIPLQNVSLKNAPLYIPLGFEKPSSLPLKKSSEYDMTFGLVSRAVERKGWEEAIMATIQVRNAGVNCRLMLVGAGEYQERLMEKFGHLDFIQFVGASAQVLNWVNQFDLGLFTSYIESESYPNTVIEYLACGKPVIGTDIGEVKNMISTPDGQLAGQLLTYDPLGISVEELADCLLRYAREEKLLQEHSTLAEDAFRKFDMNQCVAAYEAIYQS